MARELYGVNDTMTLHIRPYRLLNDLVFPHGHPRRDHEAETFGSLHVDDHLKLGGLP